MWNRTSVSQPLLLKKKLQYESTAINLFGPSPNYITLAFIIGEQDVWEQPQKHLLTSQLCIALL